MVLGSTGLAYVISEISNHVFNKGSGKGQQDHQLSISRDYFIQNSSPQSWRDAMIQHFSYLMEKQTAFNQRLLWSQMPYSLRTDLIHYVCREEFDKISLFKSVKTSVLCTLYKYTEHCMAPKDSFMYTFETGSGGLYFVIKGYAEVVDEHDDSKYNDTGDDMMVIASIQEGMCFGHESLLNSTFDYLGIRAKSDLSTLFISNENLSRMNHEVPLIYDTLLYIIKEAAKISTGVYDNSRNSSVRSVVAQKADVVVKCSSALSPTSHKLRDSIKSMYRWVNSDADEANTNNVFKVVFSELKSAKEKKAERRKSFMSDVSYESFLLMKTKRRLLDISTPSSAVQSEMRSNRNIYASLYRASEEISKSQSLSGRTNRDRGHSDKSLSVKLSIYEGTGDEEEEDI